VFGRLLGGRVLLSVALRNVGRGIAVTMVEVSGSMDPGIGPVEYRIGSASPRSVRETTRIDLIARLQTYTGPGTLEALRVGTALGRSRAVRGFCRAAARGRDTLGPSRSSRRGGTRALRFSALLPHPARWRRGVARLSEGRLPPSAAPPVSVVPSSAPTPGHSLYLGRKLEIHDSRD